MPLIVCTYAVLESLARLYPKPSRDAKLNLATSEMMTRIAITLPKYVAQGLELKRHVDVTLGRGNIYEAVKLPPGEDVREWLAVNTVDMYNAISVLYLTLVDFCSDSSCPTMSAGPKYEYLWADGVKVKKPMKVTAPQYVNALFDWIEEQVGSTFPSSFKEVVKKIFKRLFRVYAHIYHSHFHEVCSLKAEAHLNTCFKHFILFAKHYDLVDEKELAPLQELIEKQTAGVVP